VDGYLTKPIDIPALLKEIEILLLQGAAPKKVLIIEEDAGAVQSLSEALLAQSYQVSCASSETEALAKASDHPDLIIINTLLAERHDLIRRLRFEKGLENVAILSYQ
jgi:DNA-binding response OmpR family regulator